MSGPVKRPYESPTRRNQARRTRARIRDAAVDLFVEQGYVATSIASVAERAGVAPQTVYAVFGTKAALLAEAVDVTMAGDDEPVAVFDRPAAQRSLTSDTPGHAAAQIARFTTDLLERAGGILRAAEDAARQDPDIRALWIEGHNKRLADFQRLARALHANAHLRPGLTVDRAADLMWVYASPDTYWAFTQVRGWTTKQYERWLRVTLERTVLAT